MGYSLSWIAVKERPNEEIQRILGLRKTGKHGDYGKHSLVGHQLRDGWYILIANTSEDRITKGKILTKLSKGCQAVACSIEEHVMFSSCAFWNKGKKIWSVKHRGEEGAFDVVNSGKLPENYSLLKDQFIAKQKSEGGERAEVDHVFELPLSLAKQLVGFKHDEEISDLPDGSYEIFEYGYLQRISRAVSASLPWLYVVGVVALLGFAMIVARDLIGWAIQLVKGFVS
jgi:hypothetical protein